MTGKNWLRAKKIVHDFIDNGFYNFVWSFEILLCRMEENLSRIQKASVTTVVEFLKELKWYFTHNFMWKRFFIDMNLVWFDIDVWK